jgi:hypothetical protein
MDAAAYEATPRTVGKWIVPLAKGREMERKFNALAARVQALESVAMLAARLDTSQDCDPAHHSLVIDAMEALTRELPRA